ncbi:MAG TPA: NAD-dependent epimerase/dehydratase family protein [Candidatus Tumulicola sp.]|jgi:GDP-4-dehydro-6-deoxy-D-mannose reductase
MTHTLLVTGAQGFVGRWFVAEALRRWPTYRIVGIGRSARRPAAFTHEITLGTQRVPAPLPSALRGDFDRFTYCVADIRDTQTLVRILRESRPTYVVHLASALRDDPPHMLFPINVEGTISLLTAITQADVGPEAIVIGSSGSVYGAPESLPIGETDCCVPNDLYAISKYCAEMAATLLAREAGLPIVLARIFNIVGPGLDERHACARFASQFSAICAGLSERCISVGDLSNTRDFIDVRDVATAIVILLERGVSGTTYNVASGRETAMHSIFRTLAKRANLDGQVRIEQSYRRASDCPRAYADISRLRSLDFYPRWTISESLRSLYSYYVDSIADVAGQTLAVTPSTSAAAVDWCRTHG